MKLNSSSTLTPTSGPIMNDSKLSTAAKLEWNQEMALLNLVQFYVHDMAGSILFTLGMLFNLMSFTYFQLSRSFRDTSMRHYFSVISISDSLRLSEWLFAFLMDKRVLTLNKAWCQSFLFVVITSGHISIWLLVFLSIERYIILQFPFQGKQFYTTRNSLRLLCILIVLIIIIDIPYLLPTFIDAHLINHELHLVACITNPLFRTYMFANNILLYSIVPFFLLLIFNCLLIGLLARQKTQLHSLIQSNNCESHTNNHIASSTVLTKDGVGVVGGGCGNQSLNALAKRDRQFKERTILLILVTFFLLLTVSPRYIAQMILTVTNYRRLSKITLTKCLNVLEMLNFSLNFLFYIICSKTSRTELNLILYYYFYWRWSKHAKKYVICNHPNHNREALAAAAKFNAAHNLNNANSHSSPHQHYHHHPSHRHYSAGNINNVIGSSNMPSSPNNHNGCDHDNNSVLNNYNLFTNIPSKKNSRLKIHCFLINASRLKQLEQNSNNTQNTSTSMHTTNPTMTTTTTGAHHQNSLRSTNSERAKRSKTATNESLKSICEEDEKRGEKTSFIVNKDTAFLQRANNNQTSQKKRLILSKSSKEKEEEEKRKMSDFELMRNMSQELDEFEVLRLAAVGNTANSNSSSSRSSRGEYNEAEPEEDFDDQPLEPSCVPKSMSNHSLTWRIFEKKTNLTTNP